jgi:hypothetical protein
MKKKISPQHELFALIYAANSCRNAAEAYKQVYPKTKEQHANRHASRLLKRKDIDNYLRRVIAARNKKYKVTADKIIKELASIAFTSIKDFYDAKGNPIPIQNLPDTVAASIKGKKADGFGIANTSVNSKIKALDLLAKINKLYSDAPILKVDPNVIVEITNNYIETDNGKDKDNK